MDSFETNFKLADDVLAELLAQMPFLHRATMASSNPTMDDRKPELQFICERLQGIYGPVANWLPQAVRSYVLLSLEFLRLQEKLEKTGHYLLSTEREALDRVYNNPAVFGGYYLPGLLLSEALWPNHFLLNDCFKGSFLSRIPPNSDVVEVGVGTGYHLYQLKRSNRVANYIGLDISNYAIDFCQKFSAFEHDKKTQYRFFGRNISEGSNLPVGSADVVIMGEILEHIENPLAALREMARVARSGAHMFMTTVVFAANIDHIFLFENVDDIHQLIKATEWDLIQDWALPVYPSDSPDMTRRPMNYGAILQKRG